MASDAKTQYDTIIEIYNVLNQLTEAYGNVMMTFQSVAGEVSQLRNDIADLREFNRGLLTDAASGLVIWRDVANAHKEEAAQLRRQLELLTGQKEK